MTASKALVGPVKVVYFRGGPGGPFEATGQVIYDVPRNTLDQRYGTCVDHHVACDCREAELNESISELHADYRAMYRAIQRAIRGHSAETCQCGACGIARELHLTHLSWIEDH